MDEAPNGGTGAGLPRELRFLKTLVTVLTLAMILGVITIVTLLVIRLNAGAAPVRIDPGMFVVPDGVGVVGISVIAGRTVIVADDGAIRVYDSESRALLQEMDLP
ncbi:DUF6476 family protein [Roseicyclus sp.]|uniref:DUF6476 family protein n=1 Tax=Roseicyclus sp. TaxID=1914329 RepID=UPI003F9FBA77